MGDNSRTKPKTWLLLPLVLFSALQIGRLSTFNSPAMEDMIQFWRTDETPPTNPIHDIVKSIAALDLIAEVYYDKDHNTVMQDMKREKNEGKRDSYFLPASYKVRLNNTHYNDSQFTDEYQKEVYLMARNIMRRMVPANGGKRAQVLDVGCGYGYKLVKYLSPEFHTVGFETEPAISHLKKTYPNHEWVHSGKPEESLPATFSSSQKCDLAICADVVEHMRDPNVLMKFLKSLNCTLYVISTPDRVHVPAKNGPPMNPSHVREWTLHEFRNYVEEQGFTVLHSSGGIQKQTTQFHVASILTKKATSSKVNTSGSTHQMATMHKD